MTQNDFFHFEQTSNNEVLNYEDLIRKHNKNGGQADDQACVVNGEVFANLDRVPSDDVCKVTFSQRDILPTNQNDNLFFDPTTFRASPRQDTTNVKPGL